MPERALTDIDSADAPQRYAAPQSLGTRQFNSYRATRGLKKPYTGQVVVNDDGSPIEISSIAEDHTNSRLLIADVSGFVRVIEHPLYSDDDGEPIAFDVQSKDFMLSTRRHFPRWVKWDVDAGDAEVTGEYLLAGSVLTAHTITGPRDARRRLLDSGNGTRASMRLYGAGVVTIYAAEAE